MAPTRKVQHTGRVTTSAPAFDVDEATQALAVLHKAAGMAPLPRQGHDLVDQAVAVLAAALGLDPAAVAAVPVT